MTSLGNNPVESHPRKIPVWSVVVTFFALTALLVVLAFGLFRTEQSNMQVGKVIPTFSLQTFDGKQLGMADLTGKVVVINFWASWCTTCELEAEDLETAWQSYQSRGDVLFIGVDYVDTEPEARAYLQKYAITYPSGPDLGTALSTAFGVTGVPETFIFDRSGSLVFIKIGPFSSIDELRYIIDPLLNS